MDKKQLRQKIYEELQNTSLSRRMKAIQLLPKLQSHESLQIIKNIFKKERALGTKLEAIRILPQLITQETFVDISELLQISVKDVDLEVVRNVLLTIREIPPEFVSKSLISDVIEKLHSKDTDLQYHAIITLLHLRARIPAEELRLSIQQLTKHPNKVLQDMARKAIHELNSSITKETK